MKKTQSLTTLSKHSSEIQENVMLKKRQEEEKKLAEIEANKSE